MMRNLKSKYDSRFTIHDSLPLPRGLSLIEVLAAIFVVSIGLLGVLAVIPYGMYQTKRAAIAEHGGNLARVTCAKFQLREWSDPDKIAASFCSRWVGADQSIRDRQGRNTGDAFSWDYDSGNRVDYLNCTAPIIFDPIGVAENSSAATAYYNGNTIKAVQRVSLPTNVSGNSNPFMTRSEAVTFCMGSDDLSYAPSNTDSGRTSLFTYNEVPLSKGDYSWFLTIQAKEFASAPSSYRSVPLGNPNFPGLDVDALVCYQRAPASGADGSFQPAQLSSYYLGGQVTLNDEPDLKDTKYVFLVGPDPNASSNRVIGRWYRVVSTAAGSNFHMTLEAPGGATHNFNSIWGSELGNPQNFRLVVIQGVINHISVP